MVKAEFRGFVTGLAILGALTLLAIGLDIQALDTLNSVRFHLAGAMLALPVLLVLVGTRWRALIMLVLVLASLGQGALIVLRQQEARTPLAGIPSSGEFVLLNYNVLSGNLTGEVAADSIVRAEPDVAVIMEAPGIAAHFGRLQASFPYHAGCDSAPCDLLLLSKTPLIDAQVRGLGPLGRLRLITARTVIGDEMVTLVAVHLSKPYFDENAWVELWQIGRTLADIEGPLVISGDFNAAAWSEALSSFVAQERLVPPPRYPATWPVILGEFGVPIDNIFTRGGLLIEDISATPAYGSNHRGLLARIGIKPSPR